MSGVDYPKVIDQLTDVIKELNVGFAPCGAAAPAAPSEETRRADAVGLVKALLSTLEQGGAAGAGAAAAAEHGATDDKNTYSYASWQNLGDLSGEKAKQAEAEVLRAERERVEKANAAHEAERQAEITNNANDDMWRAEFRRLAAQNGGLKIDPKAFFDKWWRLEIPTEELRKWGIGT